VPDNIIIKFVTGGPKNYAHKIAKPDKDGNTIICKVRGITLNYKNSLTINFDAIKDMVINNRDDVKTMWIFTSEKKLD
jgi:frataxin-like iron-binding protein CyaY